MHEGNPILKKERKERLSSNHHSLVVFPTHLKNMSQIGSFPQGNWGENSQKIFELPPAVDHHVGAFCCYVYREESPSEPFRHSFVGKLPPHVFVGPIHQHLMEDIRRNTT